MSEKEKEITMDMIVIDKESGIAVYKDYTVPDCGRVVMAALAALRKDPTMSGNGFLTSICNFFNQRGYLSPKQYYAAVDILSKYAVKDDVVKFDATPVQDAFHAYADAGLVGQPTIRITGYRLKKHDASIAVYAEDVGYVGAIVNGMFAASRKMTANKFDFTELEDMFKHFHKAVTDYGHLTNNCGCCGRKLTDPVSVERGIGPICEKRFGLGG